MKSNQHEPIFFTPPSGDVKRPRRLYKGGGGGDGGAAKRKAEEDARVNAAIQKLNAVFGVGGNNPESLVDQSAFWSEVVAPPPKQTSTSIWGSTMTPTQSPFNGLIPAKKIKVFNRSGYDAAVAAARDKYGNALEKRESLYSTIGDDATNKAVFDLDKDRATTERDFKFMLARAGLSGGSRDIDVNRELLDTHQQGVLKAAELGAAATNSARSADDKTRVNLINSIRAGLDEGSAMQQAYEGMSNNARTARDDANATSLAGFFDVLRQQQQQAAYNQGTSQAVEQYKKTPYSSAVSGDRGRTSSY